MQPFSFTNKIEREEVLKDLYKAVFELISRRLEKSKSVKTVANNRNKIEITVYVDSLRKLVAEGKSKSKANFAFAKKLQNLVAEISADKNLQKKLISAYWRETFNESFDLKAIEQKEQSKLF